MLTEQKGFRSNMCQNFSHCFLPGSGHGFVIETDEMYNPLDKFNEEDPLTSMIKRTLITRLDVCACCASKHISFCCTACMKQKGLLKQQDGDVVSTDQDVFTKLSNLKLSSCACCELSGRRGKCCSWCPRLASVEKWCSRLYKLSCQSNQTELWFQA